MMEKQSVDIVDEVFCPPIIQRLSSLNNFISHRSFEANYPQNSLVCVFIAIDIAQPMQTAFSFFGWLTI